MATKKELLWGTGRSQRARDTAVRTLGADADAKTHTSEAAVRFQEMMRAALTYLEIKLQY